VDLGLGVGWPLGQRLHPSSVAENTARVVR
jgi:hypothetical protein